MRYVVEAGGFQYCVSPGESFWALGVLGGVGDVLALRCLASWDDSGLRVGSGLLGEVQARVEEIRLGGKVRGFVYKPKKNIRSSYGYRAPQVRLVVLS